MKLTSEQRLICERVINVFETGSVRGDYAAISIYRDGPHRVRQITYGRSQTTEYGKLGRLVAMYADAKGAFSDELRPYVDLIGNYPLVDHDEFKSLLRRAGADPVMQAAQDKFFDLAYFQPAKKWATDNGFVRPLSMLVIYDSFIHSGRILSFLRSRFAAVPPAKGGSEEDWITSYIEVRHRWLTSHGNPDVRPSAYRTRDMLREIRRSNWDLALLPIIANGTPVNGDGGNARPRVSAIAAAQPDALVPYLGEFEENTGPASSGSAAESLTSFTVLSASEGPAGGRAETLTRLAVRAGVSGAAERLITYRDRHRPTSDPRYWAVADFNLHSAKPRLFLFDCVAGTTSTHLCAHGRGSEGQADDGYPAVFSNEDGSNCSSLGIYHCDVTYIGGHGKSLYLDGLEPTNSNARRRHIVMHGADYVSPEMIARSGRIGRSLGCPAIEVDDVPKVIPALMGGSLLIIWKG